MPESIRDLTFRAMSGIDPWANETIANLGGTQASARFSDPVSAVMSAVNDSPGAFINHAGFFVVDPQTQQQVADTPDTSRSVLDPLWLDQKIAEWLAGSIMSGPNGQSYSAVAGKYIVLVLVGLILLAFGLWAIIGTKTIVTAAKGAAA